MNQDAMEQRLHRLTYELVEANRTMAELANLIVLIRSEQTSGASEGAIYSVAARLSLQSSRRAEALSSLDPLNLNH
jgi:hypothetical protein